MSSVTTIFREAHRLRRHLRDLQAEIDRGPRLLKVQQAKLARQEEEFKAAQDGLKHLKVSVHEKEVSLKATHQQIAKSERQLNDILNKREYDAKQLEIANGRARCAQLEEEILTGLGEIDEQTARMPDRERSIQQARAEAAGFEKEAQARLERHQAEYRRAEAELKEVEAGLPGEVRPQYQRLIAAHGADALAAVRDRTCTQCYTGITAQNQNDLQAGNFVTCKSCGRGLYLPE